MNKFIFILTFVLFNLFFNNSFAQIIVFADMEKILKSSNAGKHIMEHFYNKKKTLQSEIETSVNSFAEKEKKLLAQKNILDEEQFNNKINELKNEIINSNNENNKKLKKINSERDKVTKSFLNEVNNIIQEFSKKNNIDIVLKKKDILIGKNNLDITNDIFNIVNTKIKKFKLN